MRAGAWPEDARRSRRRPGTPTSCTSCCTRSKASPRWRPRVRTTCSRRSRPHGSRPGSPTRRRCGEVRTVRGVLRAVDGRGPRRPGARCSRRRAPVREMIVYAMRWRIDRPTSDPTADAFFAALALLTADWLDSEKRRSACRRARRRSWPRSWRTRRRTSPTSTSAAVCAAVGLSERSLRRQFRAETGTSWQHYRMTSRIMRAMAILAGTRAHGPRRRRRGRIRQSERLRPGVPPSHR